MNPSPFSRREMLTTLSSGIGWLAFSALAQAKGGLASKQPHFAARAKRVIFLTMRGGPSHVDLFDHKPELIKRDGQTATLGRDSAGAKLFGPVYPLKHFGKSGQWMTTLYPKLAQHADELCIINSMHTDLPNHAQAFGQMHTGSFQFVRPSIGAWTLYGLGTENENLPGFITLNPPADNGGAQNYGSAFLPAICQGTRIGGSQLPELYAALLKKDAAPGPPMKNIVPALPRDLQRAQLDLIRGLNEHKLERDGFHPEIEGAIESFELAFRMQSEVPDVLDLRSEPAHILKLYGIGQGKDQFARQCLLARRMAEAGVRFIEIASPGNWDHHNRLRELLTTNCAATDQPIAALLSDLKSRGMLKDTLVVWAGEFGRTPYAQSGDGRDHNHKGYSIWMAGGGVKGGLTYGATDEVGHKAELNPMHIHDWHATMLHLLGLDHTKLTYSYGGRNFRLTNVSGEVAKGILA
ncbi:MAG: DUF1501 domain-containing protein [Prosthecobacter sp.]|uniref:DUF1501 domain-containing protein n=1 Tax=Prosthecobacter sp. TaxID=1965333 RepID=UPI0025DE4CA8|nr:DUF1501 domain-containing protein [Prosthecobacter sp.]MCF7787420.1 DUF1501 domain-containing protein [Prosthecobacter sp.]